MGTCISKPTVDDMPSLGTGDVTSQESTSPQQQRVANPGRESNQGIDVSSYGRPPTRDRAQSTPHKVRRMNDVEMPPLPRQRTRAKSSVAWPSSSPRNTNPDYKQTNAGKCDARGARVPSLTMTRALKDYSQTKCNGLSRPPATQL